MKKGLVIIALLIACLGLKAQATFSTVGGEAALGSAKLSYTAGQASTQNTKARVANAERKTAILTEGVQQAYSIEELRIDGATPITAEIKIYPNPTTDKITVKVAGEVQLNYILYDASGRKLSDGKLQNGETTIDMSEYAVGSYVLKVIGNGAENGYRITKGH